jgi:phosphoglycolate phosphatase
MTTPDAPLTVDMPRLVVCDMAGTTVEDDGQVPAAFSATLARFGIAIGGDALRAVRGASKRDALRQLLGGTPQGDGRAEEAFEMFRTDLADRFQRQGVRAVPGAVRTFAVLRSRGIRIALNTGFDRDTTRLLLEALGWTDGRVDVVVCGDDVRQGRPAPDLILRAMERAGVTDGRMVASVGDTVLDLRAGHAAGVRWNIGVLSGAHDRTLLEAEPHTHVLASVAQLTGLWPGRPSAPAGAPA